MPCVTRLPRVGNRCCTRLKERAQTSAHRARCGRRSLKGRSSRRERSACHCEPSLRRNRRRWGRNRHARDRSERARARGSGRSAPRLIAIEQRRPDAVLPHGADAMCHEQPALVGFDRRTAVAELDDLPGVLRALDDLGFFPVQDVVGLHVVEILVVDREIMANWSRIRLGKRAIPLFFAHSPVIRLTSIVSPPAY